MRLRHTYYDIGTCSRDTRRTRAARFLISAFIYGQVGAPSSLLLALFGPFRYGLRRRGLLREVRAAYRRGKATAPLAAVFWEELAEPLAAVRQRVACPAA